MNIFSKTNQKKEITEKTDTDLHFYKSLISGLTENSWILLSASSFNLLQFFVLVKIAGGNLASPRFIRKGRSI